MPHAQHPGQSAVLTSLPVNLQGLRGGRSWVEGREEKCFSASFTTSSWSTPSEGEGLCCMWVRWVLCVMQTGTSSCSQDEARSRVVSLDVVLQVLPVDPPGGGGGKGL